MSSTDFFDDDLIKGKEKPGQASAGLGQPVVTERSAERDALPPRPVSDLNLGKLAKHRDETGAQVANAMKEIERLRRRQEELEREKQTLEETSRRQEEYEQGKREMIDKLEQSVALLEKREVQSARLTETYSATRQRFKEILQDLQKLDDTKWPEEAIREELNKAVVLIDDSRKEYNKAIAKVEASDSACSATSEAGSAISGDVPRTASSQPGMLYWSKVGLAVTSPLIVVIVILFVVHAMMSRAGF